MGKNLSKQCHSTKLTDHHIYVNGWEARFWAPDYVKTELTISTSIIAVRSQLFMPAIVACETIVMK